MISKSQKKEIKTLLGHRYVSVVKKELSLYNELNLKGKPFSSSVITNVMNQKSHAIIEAAIWRAVENKKALKIKREHLLIHMKNVEPLFDSQ